MLDRAAIHRDWFSNIRADVLAGLVVALALIPEAIGFSIIAGVDPRGSGSMPRWRSPWSSPLPAGARA